MSVTMSRLHSRECSYVKFMFMWVLQHCFYVHVNVPR